MWNIFRFFVEITWICDILNLKGFEMLDTTYPINTLWWIVIWMIIGGINSNNKND